MPRSQLKLTLLRFCQRTEAHLFAVMNSCYSHAAELERVKTPTELAFRTDSLPRIITAGLLNSILSPRDSVRAEDWSFSDQSEALVLKQFEALVRVLQSDPKFKRPKFTCQLDKGTGLKATTTVPEQRIVSPRNAFFCV